MYVCTEKEVLHIFHNNTLLPCTLCIQQCDVLLQWSSINLSFLIDNSSSRQHHSYTHTHIHTSITTIIYTFRDAWYTKIINQCVLLFILVFCMVQWIIIIIVDKNEWLILLLIFIVFFSLSYVADLEHYIKYLHIDFELNIENEENRREQLNNFSIRWFIAIFPGTIDTVIYSSRNFKTDIIHINTFELRLSIDVTSNAPAFIDLIMINKKNISDYAHDSQRFFHVSRLFAEK